MQIVREDRFSRLPDDILVNILDRLNVGEAARTSVLAWRWRHLSAVLSRLTIDVRDFVAKPGTTCREEGIELSNAAVVEVTKSILACRVSSPYIIRSMRMAFFLRDDDCISNYPLDMLLGTSWCSTQLILSSQFLQRRSTLDTIWTIRSTMGDDSCHSLMLVQLHLVVSHASA
jgi:hypothetical protein